MLVLSCSSFGDELRYRFNPPPGERPIVVEVQFFLSDLNEINDQSETFEIKGVMMLSWKDSRHSFNADQEGVSAHYFQGPFQFLEEYNSWCSQLILINSVNTISRGDVQLRISPDGTLDYFQEVSAVVESPMSLRRFPFDKQNLEAIFEPLGYYAGEITLIEGAADIPERSINVAGWELVNFSSEDRIETDENSGAKYSQLVINLDVKRYPAYIIWFDIVPLSLIVLLSTSVFWMGRQSLDARMDISFIGLLTIVAYQTVVVSQMPQISYFTLLDGFVYVAYLTMTACVVANIWVGRLDRKGKTQTAGRFDKFGRWAFPAGFFSLNGVSAVYFFYL